MKKIKQLAVVTLATLACSELHADEGMWLLPMIQKLNISTMQEMGFELSSEDIFSIDSCSLKDAVVIFGGGCTGEIVSDKGLIFTNHHCGYSSIQQLSSVEHNYLRDGFWAKSHEEELPVKGLSVKFLRKMEDVTCQMLDSVSDNMTEEEREQRMAYNMENIIAEYSSDNGYTVDVESYYEGNMFYVVAYEVFTDVRLVGTPPESIGKFGHDTDNWMWPRHTGDFSIFRVYTDREGKPAEYSVDNIPMKSKRFFPISLSGYKPGDFAMIMGFPGSTDRYLSSWGIEDRMNAMNDALIKVRGVKQNIWLEDMLADEKVNIQYASKYSSSTNYWKNSIGMNKGIKRLNVIGKKQQEEADFASWVKQDEARIKQYGNVLSDIKKIYTECSEYNKTYWYLLESFWRGVEIFRFAYDARAIEKMNEGELNGDISLIKEYADSFYKDYNVSTDKKVFVAMLKYYHNTCGMTKYTFLTDKELAKYAGNYETYVNQMFEKSIFTNEAKRKAFFEKPSVKELKKDAVYQTAKKIVSEISRLSDDIEKKSEGLDVALRLYMKGVMEMNEGRKELYPDANFTMRMTYGKVDGYNPIDAVRYNYFTTMAGVMEKEDSTNWEFVVSPELKAQYASGDYGAYADADGTMHVCFLTNNDITGGNSGSPVIDAKGRLLGLAFDGNWEAMSGDIIFEPELQRCINVDIRYVLFVIDKIGKASNIIAELQLEK